MSLDERIDTKHRPMFGCHSDLGGLSKRDPFACDYETRDTEKACDGCERKVGVRTTAPEGHNAELTGRASAACEGPR